jgi:uncharacterized membrane protein (DUF2068 family)
VKRPIGITIIALIQVFVAVIVLLGAVALLLGNQSQASQQALTMAHLSVSRSTEVSIGVFALIIAGIELLIAWGLFQLKGWAWGLSVFAFGANVVFSVLDLINRVALTQSQQISMVISLLVLIYLLTPGVREAFFRRASHA